SGLGPPGDAGVNGPSLRTISLGGESVLLVAAFLAGAIGAVLQVGWTRVATLAFGSTGYALGIPLAVYIFGLGAGPFILRRRLVGGGTLLAAGALAGVGLSSLFLVPVLGRLPIFAAWASSRLET